jgi:mannose-6-phosphate isomerase-like protein (cupin superfamily)
VSAPYDVATIDELESFPGPGTLRWTPIRRRFGLTAFGINAYTADGAGRDVVEEHTEQTYGHEEVYVVVAGRATFTVGGETVDAPTGTIVVIRDPKRKRHAAAAAPGTTVLAVGGRPGAHEPSAWEWSFAAYGYHQQGETERGIAELRDGLEAESKPDVRARLLYDWACLECLAGRGGDKAIEYLLEAVELDPKYREYATDDSDLDAIREDPRFPR